MLLKESRKFEDLEIGDNIYLFTKEDVRKIRIIGIQKTIYNFPGYDPDYYMEFVDIDDNKIYRVLVSAKEIKYKDEYNEVIYVIDPYFNF
jgi:hypothetical protein